MMGLARGKVSECTARLALAQMMIKVRMNFLNIATDQISLSVSLSLSPSLPLSLSLLN